MANKTWRIRNKAYESTLSSPSSLSDAVDLVWKLCNFFDFLLFVDALLNVSSMIKLLLLSPASHESLSDDSSPRKIVKSLSFSISCFLVVLFSVWNKNLLLSVQTQCQSFSIIQIFQVGMWASLVCALPQEERISKSVMRFSSFSMSLAKSRIGKFRSKRKLRQDQITMKKYSTRLSVQFTSILEFSQFHQWQYSFLSFEKKLARNPSNVVPPSESRRMCYIFYMKNMKWWWRERENCYQMKMSLEWA